MINASKTADEVEPLITINGYRLTPNAARTLRVAMESFAYHLEEKRLGEDAHGAALTELYKKGITEFRRILLGVDEAQVRLVLRDLKRCTEALLDGGRDFRLGELQDVLKRAGELLS